MSDDPIPTNPQTAERGALTGGGAMVDIALAVSMAANAVPVVKAGVDVGAHVYDLLHPSKPEVVKPILPSGVSKD